MRELIKQRIKGALEDLQEFHQNTFNYREEDPYMSEDSRLTGKDIQNYTQGLDMSEEEDACYIAGRLDAYRDILRQIDKMINNEK